MRERGIYDSRFVCLSVAALAATYLVYKSKVRCYNVPYGVQTYVSCGFVENALFSSFGIICLQSLPSMLSEKFSMDRTDST